MTSFLLIEDDQAMARLIQNVVTRGLGTDLGQLEFIVVARFDDALEELRKRDDFRVVFLDLNLPDRRAEEAALMITAIKAVSKAVVFVLTGVEPAGELRRQCIGIGGAETFWEKPHLHNGQAAFCGSVINCLHKYSRKIRTQTGVAA